MFRPVVCLIHVSVINIINKEIIRNSEADMKLTEMRESKAMNFTSINLCSTKEKVPLRVLFSYFPLRHRIRSCANSLKMVLCITTFFVA